MPAAAAAAAAAAASARKGLYWLHDEAHVADIDVHSLDLVKERFAYAECKAAGFKGRVLVIWLIQSQGKPGTASAAGGEIDADARLGTVREKCLKFALSACGEVDHPFSPVKSFLYR